MLPAQDPAPDMFESEPKVFGEDPDKCEPVKEESEPEKSADLILNNYNIFTQSLILDIVCTQIFRHTLAALFHRIERTIVILIHII